MQRQAKIVIGIAVASVTCMSLPAPGVAAGQEPVSRSSLLDALVGPPAVTTGPAGGLSASTATLSGSVDTHGLETSAFFRYGPTTAYGSTTAPQAIAAGMESRPFQAAISGLRFATTYHFEAVARNAAGEASGADGSFTTPDAVVGGTYSVTLTVKHGGRAFGQRAGRALRRPYRFTAHCAGGLCPWLRLHRKGADGTFASVLNRRKGERYVGLERSRGRCDNGERFRARTKIAVLPTSEAEGRATRLEGSLTVRARGCLHATEVARFTARRAGP